MRNMKKDLAKAYVALGIVSFFWGTTYVAARMGVRHVPGLFVSGLRQFLAGSLLTGFFLLKGYRLPSQTVFTKLVIQGIILLCVANSLLTWSLQYISGGLAAIITGLVPLFITVFSIFMVKNTRLTRWMITG